MAITAKQYGGPLQPITEFGVINTSRKGILRSHADEVANLIGLSDKEIAYVLGMTPRNLHRIQSEQLFGMEATERLLLLKNLLLHALDTFEGKSETVARWFRTPVRELDNQSPLNLLDTVTGFGLVDDVLGRIDHGIPA